MSIPEPGQPCHCPQCDEVETDETDLEEEEDDDAEETDFLPSTQDGREP